MGITNKTQFKRGMDVETWLDGFFREKGWTIQRATAHQERVLCLGDRLFIKGPIRYWVEYKSGIQTYYTGNVFLETISVDTANKPGWLYTCKADYIMYAILLNDKILVFDPDYLRHCEPTLKRAFREVATCNNQNDGYRTHGLLIPLPYAETHLAVQIIKMCA